MPRRLTNFYIDEDLQAGLELVKERDGVLVSEQIRRAIRAWLIHQKALKPAQPAKRKGVVKGGRSKPRTAG